MLNDEVPIKRGPGRPRRSTKKVPGNGVLSGELEEARAPALLDRPELARELGTSVRTVANLMKSKKIPCIRISARCIRFSLPAVLTALSRFEVREVGRE
jgi:hypothetical protein